MEIPNTIELLMVFFNLRNNKVDTKKDSMKQMVVVVKFMEKKCSNRIPNMRQSVKNIMGEFKTFIKSKHVILSTYNNTTMY